jgi:hypothetical protein
MMLLNEKPAATQTVAAAATVPAPAKPRVISEPIVASASTSTAP